MKFPIKELTKNPCELSMPSPSPSLAPSVSGQESCSLDDLTKEKMEETPQARAETAPVGPSAGPVSPSVCGLAGSLEPWTSTVNDRGTRWGWMPTEANHHVKQFPQLIQQRARAEGASASFGFETELPCYLVHWTRSLP